MAAPIRVPVRTQPYAKRAVPTSAADLPKWLVTEGGNLQRAIPILTRALGFGSAIPTDGTWQQGDIIFTETPVAGGFIGWTCTAAGTPGTWKTFGAISA